MIGHVDEPQLSGRHARDIVPRDIARTLPSIELPLGETNMTVMLPACTEWAMATLDGLNEELRASSE